MAKIKNINPTEDDIEIELVEDELEDESLESEESPDTSLEKGEADEDKAETEEIDESKKESETESETLESTDEDPTYIGKTREQIIQMHREASKKMSQQGNELGKARAEQKETEQQNIVEKLSIDELRNANKTLHSKLAKLDPEYDKEEYESTVQAIAQCEQDILEKRQTELLNNQFVKSDNQKFITDQKTTFKDKGYFVDKDGKFNDDEYMQTIDKAKEYSENGRLTVNSVYKAMIDLHGIEKVSKVLEIGTEQKTREQIKNAADKIDNKIDSKGKGSETTGSTIVKFRQMSPVEQERFLDGLSMEEIEAIEMAVNRKSGK